MVTRDEPVVVTRGLSKRYGHVVALRDIDLTVARGEIYGYLGLNGAGKTTTVRVLTGMIPPTSGRARVCGVDVARAPGGLASRVGVVFGENVAPEPRMSAVRYLRHFAALHDMRPRPARERIERLFEVLRLADLAERPVGTLSGGNQRKVEIARALLPAPELLFLDEPTRELDIPAKRAMWAFLRDIAAEGATVFVSTHDVQEIASLCTRIGILREGRLAWEGAPADLTRDGAPLVDALAAEFERPA